MLPDTLSPLGPEGGPASRRRQWTLMRAIGFLSVTLFIATEIFASWGAGVWALSGLIGVGTTGTIVLGALLGLPALFAVVKCTQLALEAETDPAND